jgi:hypothetical protein
MMVNEAVEKRQVQRDASILLATNVLDHDQLSDQDLVAAYAEALQEQVGLKPDVVFLESK